MTCWRMVGAPRLPSERCVCVRSDRMPCHHPFGFSAGGHSTSLGLCPTKLPVKWDIQLGQLDVPASVILKVYLAPLVAALFVLLVLSGNVFAARRKPSECKPNLHPLETHQLYSRLISCTRKISTLHLEFKCVHPIRVYPLCDPGPALSENLTSTCLS